MKVKKKKKKIKRIKNMPLETLFWTIHTQQFIFLKLLFGYRTANFGSLLRGQPHLPDVNHCVLHFRPEGYRESCNEVGSLSLAKCLVGFEPGSLQFLLRLNPLGHSPQKHCNSQPCRRKRSNFVIMPPRTLNLFANRNNQIKKPIALIKQKMLY